MLLSCSESDRQDHDLINTYKDLKIGYIPYKKYIFEDNVVSDEIKERLNDLSDLLIIIQRDIQHETKIGRLLCRIRSHSLGYENYITHQNFTPTKEQLTVVMAELKYFGFIWGIDLQLAKLFLFDVCISLIVNLSKKSAIDYMEISGKIPEKKEMINILKEYIANPHKDVLDSLIEEVVSFFRKNQ